jgi:hypothetical protein
VFSIVESTTALVSGGRRTQMNVPAIIAIIVGILVLVHAFTARKFDTSGEGVIPPDEQRYVPATLPMRVAEAATALAAIAFGVWQLIR